MVAIAVEPQVWRPNSVQQVRFLSSPADEALFGGAAGPGKTDCLLMEALRQIAHPLYRAILFRRVFPSLEAADGLIDRSLRWYPGYGGKYNHSKHVWTFPSGSRIYFGHMQHEKDMYTYQGAQFAFIAFDELTEFLEKMYLYMFTRNRVPADSGLRVYMRAATNPGRIGHAWVKTRFIVRDIVNRMRWFARVDEEDTEVERDHPDARSRAFYPALMTDNPHLSPEYVRNINLLADPVERAQLAAGDWDAQHTEGLVYDNWSSTENITTEADYNPDKPVFWACDDGYVYGDGPGHANYHPRVILFIQNNELGGPNIFDEIVVCEELHDTTIETGLEKSYRRPEMAYLNGSHAMFRGRLTANSIPTMIGNHLVVEGIRNVRRLICDGKGVRVLKVHPRCENLIYEMGNYRRDPREKAKGGEIVPVDMDNHCQEALRHLAWKKYPRSQ